MQLSLRHAGAVVCLFAAAAFAQTPPPTAEKKSAFDKTTLEQYIRHANGWPKQIQIMVSDPKPSTALPGFKEVTVSAIDGARSAEFLYYVTDDGQRVLRGDVFNIAENPFKANLAKLKTEFQPSMGTPGAPVVLVVFSDFQCQYCKEEAKMLRDNLRTAYPKEVRLYFKDLPLEQIHPWAKPAAIAGRCIFRQNPAAFWEYHDWIFENQASITPENVKSKVLEFAGSKNIDVLQLTRCVDTKATEAEVNKNMAEARELKVFSTPTLFVNGRRIEGNVSWPNLRGIIDLEIEYQKTAKNAGEDCGCNLQLKIAGQQ